MTEWRNVNRYGYNPYALWIPYGLVSLFTFLTVIIGIIAFSTNGVQRGIKFQDVLNAVERKDIRVAPEPMQPEEKDGDT